ncbi:hypothetical protein RHMOL_Rhmol13G0216600 [Rhododendron molle]|uniref:Uncharacterized protein n=1 Tax=Rhododendron molle TaxID=49168 RepID=A0ACC0L916_RHOML|nr:hypothetical protein RHMOL_Rhmol13G0216600 [Rhododendron molle]
MMYMNLNRQNSKTASTQQSRSSNRSVQQSRSSNITGQQTQQLKKLWMEKNLKRWMISLNVILTQTTETLNHMNTKTEVATAGTIDSESLVDNEKLGHTFPELGCDGSGGTEDLDLAKKDGSNEPSISSTTATSQETLADEESEKAVDTKQHHFMSDEPTAEPESIPEEGNGFQLEAHTMDKLDENKIRTTTAIEEESPQENEKPNVLPHIMDSETEVSREAVTMNISDDIQGPERTSLAIPHEQIASKTDPSENIERTSSKGMECGEENRMGEQSKEITEESQMIESAKMSLSDLLQRSKKRNVQVGEDVTEERELMGNKVEPQNETAETVEAGEEAVHDKNQYITGLSLFMKCIHT